MKRFSLKKCIMWSNLLSLNKILSEVFFILPQVPVVYKILLPVHLNSTKGSISSFIPFVSAHSLAPSRVHLQGRREVPFSWNENLHSFFNEMAGDAGYTVLVESKNIKRR